MCSCCTSTYAGLHDDVVNVHDGVEMESAEEDGTHDEGLAHRIHWYHSSFIGNKSF